MNYYGIYTSPTLYANVLHKSDEEMYSCSQNRLNVLLFYLSECIARQEADIISCKYFLVY